MSYVNKETRRPLSGIPLAATIQLSTHPAYDASFVLYESMSGHGFFLREAAEFASKFKVVSQIGSDVVWVHKVKGGNYRVRPGLFKYEGDEASWELGVHDGHTVKAYVYKDGTMRFTNFFDQKFESEYQYAMGGSVAFTQEPPKGLITDEGFVTVYKDDNQPFYNALVTREGRKDVRIRGDNLGEVMQAADVLLRIKQ